MRYSYLIKREAQVVADRQQPMGSSGFNAKRAFHPFAHPASVSLAPLSVPSGNTHAASDDAACLQLPMNTWRNESRAVIGKYGRQKGGDSPPEDQ
ncbi:hypothetical protein EYF80_009782 [Liparis tanakae]|uniref:Uncharacterized protein n=1 Tax=Liparis tanakae TaxID=230148 RepID=A0A4Z2IPY7_9TELE|nr:hypothetical protein EYF80_009782 [Liparis tanakae]